ncbi:piggyBac transposable element-derived protein 2-like [Schistocerca serialis cubense]|uniref:piggyBac transposable element-derived protein 2-like n=1 Tax=Schistocerca serialis cubense TaxID=2023355 RepID=UPI00214F5978|nr:piggyBac transposable element-derived protein 2-like [Schistocerca serialis cubense]
MSTIVHKREPGKSNEHYVAECLANKTVPQVFEDFLSEKLKDTIIEQHNKINFLLTKEELKSFIGILLLSGYHRLPHENMYWEQAPDVGVPLVFNSMSGNSFREIKRFIHLNDNSKIDRNDKMYKLRLYFEILKKEFGKFGVFHSELSIDEMMVRYYRKPSAKMFLRGKPIKFGYKIWCLTSSNGFLYNFSPNCGKTDNKQEPLGARVINELTSMIPESEYLNYKLFFDNFFTSVDTLITRGKSKMKATGTIREIRTDACPLIDSKRMAKEKDRGFYDYMFDKENEVLVVKWSDNKPVCVATNYSTITPLSSTKRYSPAKKKEICHISLKNTMPIWAA